MAGPKLAIIKRLFAQSGNKCAFPNCIESIIDIDGAVIGEICHICANSKGGPRFAPSQSSIERHAYDNLILLCRRHHKIIDDNSIAYSSQILVDMKHTHCDRFNREGVDEDEFHAKLLLSELKNIVISGNTGNVAINSPGAIQANIVNIRSRNQRVVVEAPPGTIGSYKEQSGYVAYLISRYNEFASKEPSRQRKFSYGAISKNLQDKYGAKWQLISIDQFDLLSCYLQERIKKTRIAKKNTKNGYLSFSTFEQHINKSQ